jgi:putative nucleotidyltransferase with HDIG domain
MNNYKRIPSIKFFKNEKLLKILIFLGTFIILFLISSLKIIYIKNVTKETNLLAYLGVFLFITVIEVVVFLFIYYFKRHIFDDNSQLFLIAIILILGTVICLGTNIISKNLIPAAFISILISIIYGPLLAIAVSIPCAGMILYITNFNPEAIIIYIIGCITGIIFTRSISVRANVLYGGLVIGFINGLIGLSFEFLDKINILICLTNFGIATAGGILSAILAIGFLPIFEQLFDVIPPIRLMEMCNPNQPLLKKMLFESPGTYHHCILVGNLAEAAAGEIGANSLLARVGAYYHDIGKIKRPYFFKENQITNDNPHDKITPKLSTIIITSHVKDGLELANKYKLPKLIKDIIHEHHGNSLVKYFYNLSLNDSNDETHEEYFRYNAPRPSTKESGIVMMADSVEAGVRSINNLTILDIDKMVNKIIKDKIDDGQLNDCDLTMKDLDIIKRTFIKVLCGMFHSRIEYPEINIEIPDGGDKSDRNRQ